MKGDAIMDLIERYLYDVGRRLPAKQREDIKKELRSLLADALDAQTCGREPTQEDAEAVLKEFGSPEEVAARYNGDQYLIGPRMFPLYKTVLFIALCALAFGLALSTALGFALTPGGFDSPLMRILQFFGSLIACSVGTVGVVTIIFFGIERGIIRERGKLGEMAGNWSPEKLPPVPKHKGDWKTADSVVAAIFTVVALIVFNSFPSVIAFYNLSSGHGQAVQILSNEALAAYLPLWNIGWICSLALHMVLLARRRWELGTNLAHVILQLFGAAVAVVMLTGPALLNPQMAELGVSQGLASAMVMLNLQFRWIFAIVIIACLAEAGKGIYRIVRNK